jgi:O-methyltransferase involved in polyketide biosynthesis
MPSLRRSESIGPTALYTGHVWARNGLSHPAMETAGGRLLYTALRPALDISGALGGPTLEGQLLARHRVLDALLGQAVADGRIGAVVEVGCGLSPRGWRFARRYGDALTYVEADLPGMAARKRAVLERTGSLGSHHRVVEVDATATDGPRSLAAIVDDLPVDVGVAVVTEGLLNYLAQSDVRAFWRRVATALAPRPAGLYVSDLVLGDTRRHPLVRGFVAGLSVFVQSRVHLHFADRSDCAAALHAAGFAGDVRVHRASDHPAAEDRAADPGARILHVVEAWVTAPSG